MNSHEIDTNTHTPSLVVYPDFSTGREAERAQGSLSRP